MDTLGAWLRETREAKGASIEEAADRTRIRIHLLKALEAGDFATLSGGEVQIRGFLRIYARYLGLSAAEVLTRYDLEIHGKEPEPAAEILFEDIPEEQPERLTAEDVIKTRGLPIIGSAPTWIGGRRALAGAAVAIVALLIILAATGVIGGTEGDLETTQTPTVEQATSPTPTTIPTVTPGFPVDPVGVITVSLEATEHVWVRATTEQAILIEGMMDPGQIETWSGRDTITVETGNGAGLLVTVNDQLLGRLCDHRSLCIRAWAPLGELDLSAP